MLTGVIMCIMRMKTMIEGLKLALKYSTKYEDRMFLQFLINVEMRKYEKVL